MRPTLKSVGLTLLLVGSTTIALSIPANIGRSPVLAQSTTTQDRKAEGDRLLEQGSKEFRRGQYREAVKTYEQALQIYRQLSDKAGMGRALNGLGQVYNGLWQEKKALEVLQQALTIHKELNDRAGEGETLDTIGTAYLSLGQNDKGSENFQEALAIRREIKDRAGEAITLSKIGLNIVLSKKDPKGLELLQQALATQQKLGDKFQAGYTLWRIGQAYATLNDYPRSLEWLQKALVVHREVGNRAFEGRTLDRIAANYFEQKQYDRALTYFQQALPLIQAAGIREFEGNLIASIGDCYKRQQKYDQAIAIYQQALPILRELGDKAGEGRNLNATGSVYALKKQYDRAIEYYQQALPIFRKVPDYSKVWLVLNNLGDAYRLKEQRKQATLYFQEALKISRTVWKDRQAEATTLESLGRNYVGLREFQKAQEFLSASLVAYREVKNKPSQVEVLISLMTAYYLEANSSRTQEKPAQVIEQAKVIFPMASEARGLAKNLDDPTFEKRIREQESNAYAVMGGAYLDLVNLSTAEELLLKATKVARDSENYQSERTALTTLGVVYSLKGENYKLVALNQREIELSRKLGNPMEEVFDLMQLSLTFFNTGEAQKEIQFAQQALEKAEKIDPKSILPELQRSLWLAKLQARERLTSGYLNIADYDKALEVAQQNVQFAQSISDAEIKVGALIRLGEVYVKQQKVTFALDALQQAWEIAQQSQRPELETEALVKLSAAWIQQEDYGKALQFAQQAMITAQKGKAKLQEDLRLQQQARSALVNVYAAQGKYTEVLKLLQEGVEQEKLLTNQIGQATGSTWQLGTFYQALGDYPKAAAQFQQLLTKAQTIKFPLLEAVGWQLLAYNAFLEQKPEKTVEFAQRGVTLARQNQYVALEVLSNMVLSVGYGEIGDESKAMASVQKSLEVARKSQNPASEKIALQVMGSLQYRFKRSDAALASYQAALAIQSKSPVTDVGSSISGSQQANAAIDAGLAKIYADRKQTATAIAFYKQAINGIETTRRNLQGLSSDLQKSFLQATFDFGGVKTVDIYRQLADLLMTQGRIAEAQEVLELLKLKELDDFTHTARSGEKSQGIALSSIEATILKDNGTLIAFGRKITDCQSQQTSNCNALRDQLTALTAQYNADLHTLEADLRNRSSADEEFINPNSQFGKAAATLIKENPYTLLVYPLVLEDKVWLLMAGQGGILKKFEVKVDRKTLSETVRQFREQLQTPHSDPAKIQATSHQLYTWLIQPLEAELASKRANQPAIHNLVFALDRVTRYIPMSALFDGKHYLMEHYTVSTIVAASFGNNRDRTPLIPQTSKALVMGVSAATGFPPLPNVKAELEAIVQTRNSAAQGIYPGQEFLDQAFDFRALQNNLTGYRILHIATHGKFEPGDAYASYLVMGKGDKLKIADIQNLPNLGDINLVTLSACETALGGAGDGIEIAGISSYFLSKGAQAVTASLWSVDDASTSLLMQQFYKNLATGKMTKAEALRQAQLSLLNGKLTAKDAPARSDIVVTETRAGKKPGDFSHPYYWAPFILIGNSL